MTLVMTRTYENQIVVVILLLSQVWLCDCSTPASSVLHSLPEFTQIHIHWAGNANHLILCYPVLLLPSTFSSMKVFSSELALHIRRPMYWSFSFTINPFNAYSGLTSFGIDWSDLLATTLVSDYSASIAGLIGSKWKAQISSQFKSEYEA